MSADLFSVQGRTAVVTGASAGLGVTDAKALAAAGANAVVAARRTEKLEAVAKEIEADGGSELAVTCDVAHADQVENLVATAWDRFGRVDHQRVFLAAGRPAGLPAGLRRLQGGGGEPDQEPRRQLG